MTRPRLWQVPETIAEYTLGTVIVLMHVAVIGPLQERREHESKRADARARNSAKRRRRRRTASPN